MRKVIRWLVYAGVFLIPLWFLPFTTDVLEFNKQILLLAVAGVGLVLFLIDVIRKGSFSLRSSAFYWPLLGFMIAGVVAMVASVDRFSSLFGAGNERSSSLLSWALFALLFFLAINVIEDRGKMLRHIFVGSLGLTMLYGVAQILGLHLFGGEFGRVAFNTIGSPKALAFFGVVAIPLFMIKPDLEKSWHNIVIHVLRFAGLLSTLFLLIVLNQSSLWIVSFITLLAYIAFTASTEGRQGKMKFFALPMAVVVIGIFLWIIHFNWTVITNKLPIEVAPKQAVSYQIASSAMKARPFGYGLENYLIGYDQHRPKETVNNQLFQARFTGATSEITTIIVEGGAPMLLASLVFIVFFVLALIRQIRNDFGSDATNGKLWASGIGLVALFFFYSFNMPFMLALLVVIVLATLSSTTEAEPRLYNLEGKSIYSLAGSVAFILGLVAVLVAGYFAVNQYIANVKLAQAAKSSDQDKAVSLYISNINSYSKDTRAYRALTQSLLKLIAEDLKPGNKNMSQAEFAQRLQNRMASVINVAVRSTEVNPADSENWLQRGYVYQNLVGYINGSDEAAINMYRESLKRSPANALAYLRIGNLYLSLATNPRKGTSADVIQSNLVAAEENYKQAIGLYDNYGQALYNLAAVYDRQGQVPQAIKQFEKLAASSPNDPSMLLQLGLLYYRNDQRDLARAAWERAVTIFPNYSNARWYLSLVYEEQNELEKALAQVKAVEKLNPDIQLVKDRLAKLEEGIKTFNPPKDVLDQTPINNQQ